MKLLDPFLIILRATIKVALLGATVGVVCHAADPLVRGGLVDQCLNLGGGGFVGGRGGNAGYYYAFCYADADSQALVSSYIDLNKCLGNLDGEFVFQYM